MDFFGVGCRGRGSLSLLVFLGIVLELLESDCRLSKLFTHEEKSIKAILDFSFGVHSCLKEEDYGIILSSRGCSLILLDVGFSSKGLTSSVVTSLLWYLRGMGFECLQVMPVSVCIPDELILGSLGGRCLSIEGSWD